QPAPVATSRQTTHCVAPPRKSVVRDRLGSTFAVRVDCRHVRRHSFGSGDSGMVARPWLVVIVLGAIASLGAQSGTKHFVVEAPSQQIADRLGQWAEYYRKEKALQWLGVEMPPWPKPCPLQIKVSYNGSGGATSFVFDRGRILDMKMEIEGTLERL